jgi:hypothetical protein
VGILDAPEDVHEINDFLPAIKMLLAIDDVLDVMPPERLQIFFGLRQFTKEQCDMAGAQPAVSARRRALRFRWAQ